MSDENSGAPAGGEKKKKKLPIVPILVVAGILLMEGGTIVVMSAISGPDRVEGVQGDGAAEKPATVEIPLFHGRLPNTRTGKKVVLQLDVYATVREEFQKPVAEAVARNGARLAHELGTIVAKLDPQELETINSAVLNRNIHTLYEQTLQEDFGDDAQRIEEVYFKQYDPITESY